MVVDLLKRLSDMYREYNEKAHSDSITNIVFEYEYSRKAYTGQYEGLKDPCIIARKAAFEENFKNDVNAKPSLNSGPSPWEEIQKINDERRKIYNEFYVLANMRRFSGELMQYAFAAVDASLSGNDRMRREGALKRMVTLTVPKEMVLEQNSLAIYLQEALDNLGPDHPFVRSALNGRNPSEAAADILKNTKLADSQFRKDLLTKDSITIQSVDDPMLNLAKIAAPRARELSDKYRDIQARLFTYHSKLGRMLFDIHGTQIPPDATFSLRINDGVVKGYEYNGTIAPPHTTFFGLYDRYYSFGKKDPYYLPKRWQNPGMDLLKTPMDFATTNDVVGGNSGSPIVNKDQEIVGLVFDGNIESLTGTYIFIPEENRTVGVHSAGILAALKYIYKSKRLVKELTKSEL
jgi:hypothetical protein